MRTRLVLEDLGVMALYSRVGLATFASSMRPRAKAHSVARHLRAFLHGGFAQPPQPRVSAPLLSRRRPVYVSQTASSPPCAGGTRALAHRRTPLEVPTSGQTVPICATKSSDRLSC